MQINRYYEIFEFSDDCVPSMTLRSGNEIDNYDNPISFEELIDVPNDKCLEDFYYGMSYLDSKSWKYYLPIFIDYSLRNYITSNSIVIDSLISSLRPPEREPPRLSTLNEEQKKAIVTFLDTLAFDNKSIWKNEAMVALEEYWAPGALYKSRGK